MTTKIHIMKGNVLTIAAGVLASAVVLIWWFGIRDAEPAVQNVVSAMRGHTSIESLSEYADVAVIGTVKGIVGREVDYGKKLNPLQIGLDKHGPGIPMVYYEIDVTEALQGTAESTIIVARMDTERRLTEEATALRTGESVLLFLLEAGDGPGMTLYDEFYVTVSLDNGVFDLLPGDIASPRLPHYFATPTADGVLETPTFSLNEVRTTIQSLRP